MKSDVIDIAAELRHETERAFLIFDGLKEVWVPKSLAEQNDDGTYTIKEWFAKDKGLI